MWGMLGTSLLFSFILSKNTKIKIYRTIILPLVSYECEYCSVTLREEHKLSVFENSVLWRIFGHKREEVVEGWRRLHNEELHNMHASQNIIRLIK
jgi:hypothetical protein